MDSAESLTVLAPYQRYLRQVEGKQRLRQTPVLNPDWINFSSNDYLGFSSHPALAQAAAEASRQYGTGATASRLVCGTHAELLALEAELAAFKGCESALVLNSGYQANVAILQALCDPKTFSQPIWIFADKWNHASLVDGCLLSGARWTRYAHNDLTDLERRLEKAPADAIKWIVTDSVFSMDGDCADLRALCDLAEQYNALTLIDEAHATGVFGPAGEGVAKAQGVSERVTLQVGTFSKALGSFGAYVAGSTLLRDVLINRARGFIYSTALPPAVCAVNRAAVKLIQTDPTYRTQLEANIRYFKEVLSQYPHLTTCLMPSDTAIQPLVLGDDRVALQLSQQLKEAGYFVQAIRPPTVPEGTSRLRITLSAAHSPEQIEGLVSALASNTPSGLE